MPGPSPGMTDFARAASFNHLVRTRVQRRRNVDPEFLGRLEIYHQLERGGLHDRQIVGFGPIQNATSINTSLAIGVRDVSAVTDQSAIFSELAERIDCGQARTRDKSDDVLALAH